MKRLLLLFLFSLTSLSFANEWYEGGNLHKEIGQSWALATAENRLATAGDFTAVLAGDKGYDMDEMLINAFALSTCISEVVKNDTFKDIQVALIAQLCADQMGW